MPVYLCRLTPPRPTFAADMSDEEQALMGEHVGYWQGLLAEGKAVAFGPVVEPTGGWGCGILEADDEAGIEAMIAADPVKRADSGFTYEVLPMPGAIVR